MANPNFIPRAEQLDTMNSNLDAINTTLQKRDSFIEAVTKMEAATTAATSAAEAAQNAASSVSMMTFDFDSDDGWLYINNPEILSGVSFEVSDGYLEVVTS